MSTVAKRSPISATAEHSLHYNVNSGTMTTGTEVSSTSH